MPELEAKPKWKHHDSNLPGYTSANRKVWSQCCLSADSRKLCMKQ